MDMEKEIKLSWLAAIIEGEGCFSFHKAGGNRKHFGFTINITNTDLIILDECAKILNSHDIHTKFYMRKVYFAHRKQGYNLIVNGLDGITKTIDLILPYMIGEKKAQAIIMREFLIRRKSLSVANVGHSARRIAYNEIDYSYFNAFNSLKNPKPVETERSPSHVDEVTVRSACISKDADFGRNDQSLLN